MKKSLLVSILTAFIVLPVMAELTTEDTTSLKYLKNHGYSDSIVENVQKSKAQIAGEPLTKPVEKEYYNQPFVKYAREFWMYIDPALDNHSFMNDHEIKTSPDYNDL